MGGGRGGSKEGFQSAERHRSASQMHNPALYQPDTEINEIQALLVNRPRLKSAVQVYIYQHYQDNRPGNGLGYGYTRLNRKELHAASLYHNLSEPPVKNPLSREERGEGMKFLSL